MTKAQKELCDRFYDDTQIDLAYTIENNRDDYSDVDDLMDYLQERVYEIEVIYYHKAMDYLKDNDPSLQESMGLAHDMGYTADNINSELLATLLQQQESSEALQGYRDELEEVFFTE